MPCVRLLVHFRGSEMNEGNILLEKGTLSSTREVEDRY